MEELEQQGQVAAEEVVSDQPEAEAVQDSTVVAPQAAEEQVIEVERNGQVERIPLSRAKEYVQKGFDYTQKTQDVARQRDELKPYMEIQNYWNNLVKTNPQKAQQVYQALYGGEEVDPRDLKLQQVESTLHGIIADNSKKDAQNRIEKVKTDPTYGGLFQNPKMEEFLLATALQKNDLNLKDTANEIHKVFIGMKADTKLETEKKIKENLKAPTRKGTSGSDTKAPPAGFNPSKASEAELRKRALEML